MQAEFVPGTERQQRTDDEHAPRAIVEMRSAPDLAKRIARDHVLEFGVERVAIGKPFVDPGIAQDLAALGHAAVVALLLVHGVSSQRCVKKPTTASVKACGCSTLEMCAASSSVMLAPGIRLRISSPAATGVDMSCRPAITSVGVLILGNSSR